MKRVDVLVVGAGPAGSMAARMCAAGGLQTLLVDRSSFPRNKVCGCCLSGAAVRVLELAGLSSLLDSLQAVRVRELQLVSGARHAAVPLTHGRIVSREALDAALVRAAENAGAEFMAETRAIDSMLESSFRRVRLHHHEEECDISARVVIAADGLAGRFFDTSTNSRADQRRTSRIGIGAILPSEAMELSPGVIRMICSDAGYVGFVRLESGRINLAAALSPVQLRNESGPEGIIRDVLVRARIATNVDWNSIEFRGTGRLTRQRRIVAGERIFAVGDSAGYIEPFTGEGMGWALSTGFAVMAVARRACTEWTASLAAEWNEKYWAMIGSKRRLCHASAFVLRHQLLTDALVRVLGFMPQVAHPLVARTQRVHPALEGLA